jgi:hypothetical protein
MIFGRETIRLQAVPCIQSPPREKGPSSGELVETRNQNRNFLVSVVQVSRRIAFSSLSVWFLGE